MSPDPDSGWPDPDPDPDPDQPESGDTLLPPGRFYRLAWVVYLVLALAGVVWLGLRLRSIQLDIFLRWDTLAADLGIGLAAGGVLIGAWALMRRAMPGARLLEDELRRMLGSIDFGEVAALALLSGFAEELFFRGAMQGALGWPVATIAFTALHTGPRRIYRAWTAFAGLAGLIFAGLVVWRGVLLPAIVGHVLVNAVNLRHLVTSKQVGDD